MPPKAEASTAYRESTVNDDDEDDFDDLDGKSDISDHVQDSSAYI